MRQHLGHLLITDQSGRQEAIPLQFAHTRIGSAADNDLVLVGPGIAPHHASVRCSEFGDLVIAVAGSEIELPRASARAVVLRIGGYVLNYMAGEGVDHSRGFVMRQAPQPTQYARFDEAALLSALLARDAGTAEAQLSEAHEAITLEMPVLILDRTDHN